MSDEHWPKESPVLSAEQLELLVSNNLSKEVTLQTIIQKSESFPIKFPVDTAKCANLLAKGVPETLLQRNVNSVYPILHESALPLFIQFLSHKKKFGSKIEKTYYKDFTVEQLVDRLLSKRAVMFCGNHDLFMLLDKYTNYGKWELVGTDKEKPPTILKNCLSYDEIKLSALLSVSSYTYFVNDGSRNNCGKYSEQREQLEDFGIIIGLIGTRLRKPEVMEYQEIVVSKEQNTKSKGYGHKVASIQGIFLNFYGESNSTYHDLKKQLEDKRKYTKLNDDKKYFNNDVYEKRMSLSFDTLLIEANERAKNQNKMAYVFVVGIGLGVWRISLHQNKMFISAFCKRIKFLGHKLNHISDVLFSYIDEGSGDDSLGDQNVIPIAEHRNGGIKVHIKNSNPHVKLTGQDEGKLLVVSYAWDGNSLPGNEFWHGGLDTSGDPAAACSTQVAELHNPHINPKVSGANLRIATLNNGVVPFCDYIKMKQESGIGK
ncbi:unnamed protein product [Ceutorhynchus assimilis]|uniref:Uncharacterized protein n=1 Tax=Ceutorhynchus assimilis TaxID=467358 RepID=A0A9P0DHJ2_9CUCU|nr:unnamed protein product [Ceutorhynchus assimilis]